MGVVGVVLFDGGERRGTFGEVFAVVEVAGIGGDAVVVAEVFGFDHLQLF